MTTTSKKLASSPVRPPHGPDLAPAVSITVRVDAGLAADFSSLAHAEGMSVSELQRLAMEDIVLRHKQSKRVRPPTIADLDKKMDQFFSLLTDAEIERKKTNLMLAHLAEALGLKIQ